MAGKKIFILFKQASQNWVNQIRRVLKHHDFVVSVGPADAMELSPHDLGCLVIACPKDIESGWVREQLDRMELLDLTVSIALVETDEQGQQEIIGGGITVFEFVEGAIFEAQEKLVAHYGAKTEPADGEPPRIEVPPRAQELVDFENPLAEVIEQDFHRRPVLLMLAQDGRADPRTLWSLFRVLARDYPEGHSFLVTIPVSSNVTPSAFFERVGRQCGFEGVRDGYDLELRLRKLLESGALLLLVRGLENGPETPRRELAGTLRAISETPDLPNRIRVVLSGGQSLAELKYAAGQMSLLNSAEALLWPDLTAVEVLRWQQEVFPAASLELGDAEAISALCGGQPLLIGRTLRYYELHGRPGSEGRQWIHQDFSARELFTPFLQNPELAKEVCTLLAEDDAGEFSLWPTSPALRRLFWVNLLKVAGNRLHWRSEMVRQLGLRVLNCG